jgi:hypothetical protein
MSVVGANMDGENEGGDEGRASRLPSPTLASESSTSELVSHADLEDVRDGSPFDVLQRAVLQIPCRQTQTSLGLVVHMMHGMEANLLKLMQHLGVTPVTQTRLNMVSLRSNSCSPQCASPLMKPQCPLCRSSNFGCEKHFVQHLCTAIDNLIPEPSRSSSHRKPTCFFSPAKHSVMMGLSAGTATCANATTFLTAYKNCFVAGEISGFDLQRCRNAADFLATSEAATVRHADPDQLGEAPQ